MFSFGHTASKGGGGGGGGLGRYAPVLNMSHGIITGTARRADRIVTLSHSGGVPDLPIRINSIFELIESRNLTKLKETFDSSCVELINENGETPLILASRLDAIDTVDFLLKNDADPNAKDHEWFSPLLNAAKAGFFGVCEALVEAGADIEDSDIGGWTPLVWACYKNRLPIVQLLLKKGACVNIIDEHSMTPLMWAAARGYGDIVRLLLAAGVRVAVQDRFGNNALLWACRKNATQIVQDLLHAGCNPDIVGMRGMTPLIFCSKLGNAVLVAAILERTSSVNTVDFSGMTALAYAAIGGYEEIVRMLINAGAFVNVVDEKKESILMKAVKNEQFQVTKELLDHHADLDYKDEQNRTALHMAVDKGLVEIVSLMLQYQPNTELRNKDGDTPLLRAARCKNLIAAQLLIQAGANVGACDKVGDTSLHIAARCRSIRLMKILLSRPQDARLLYQPNKMRETPYSIDRASGRPMMPHIFGPLESSVKIEAMMGYELYSSVLADVMCSPMLSLPVFVGLFAKWGSGKSFLLRKVKETLILFARSWIIERSMRLSRRVALAIFFCILMFASILYGVLAWSVATGMTLGLLLISEASYVYLVKSQNIVIRQLNQRMNRHFMLMKLALETLLYNPPCLNDRDFISCPVGFIFAEYRRLSTLDGEHALANIVRTFFDELEKCYGFLPVTFARAIKSEYCHGKEASFRQVCGIPVAVICLFVIVSLFLGLSLCLSYLKAHNDAVLVAGLVILVVSAALVCCPFSFFVLHMFLFRPQRTVKRLLSNVDHLRLEAFMQNLRSHVELLEETVHRLDSYARSQTRFVLFVDRLDSCEGSRILQTLDALQVLFGSQKNSPFIVLIAVDPHIVISAVQPSLGAAFNKSEISGYDYLKLIIHMALYLRNSEFVKLHQNLMQKRSLDPNRLKNLLRQEAFSGSLVSVADSQRGESFNLKRRISLSFSDNPIFGQQIVQDGYFSNINPRSMRRIVNALAITGRLMRAFDIDFSWIILAHWISLIEQWPYQLSWMIEYVERNAVPESTTLAELYATVRNFIPSEKNEYLMEMDRSPKTLEAYFKSELDPILTVSQLKSFVPFTSNLDPYIRKLIREQFDTLEDESLLLAKPEAEDAAEVSSSFYGVKKLFSGSRWQNLLLSSMSVEDVCLLLKYLPMSSQEAMDTYCRRCVSANISGLVLSVCDLEKLKSELRMSFGDWELFTLMVNHLRQQEPAISKTREVRGLFGSRSISVSNSQRLRGKFGQRRVSTLDRMNMDEAELQHDWLRSRLGHLDSVGLGDTDLCSNSRSQIHSRQSSVTFEDSVQQDNAPFLPACDETGSVDNEDTAFRPNSVTETDENGRTFISSSANVSHVHLPSPADAGNSLSLLVESDDTSQLTVRENTVDNRPSVFQMVKPVFTVAKESELS